MELLKKITGVITQFFTIPRTWQRVLVFGFLMFFVAYELGADKTVTVTLELAKKYYFLFFLVLWVGFSGTRKISDFVRIVLSGILGAFVYAITLLNAGGGTLYFQLFSYLCISIVSSWVVTGKAPSELMKDADTWNNKNQPLPTENNEIPVFDSDSTTSE